MKIAPGRTRRLTAAAPSLLQKNEGDWDFYLGDSEDGKAIVLDVKVGTAHNGSSPMSSFNANAGCGRVTAG